MEKIFAVISLGSSYITGMIATRQANGRITPLAYSQKSSRGCILHGYIYNLSDASSIIASIVDDLSEKLEGEVIKRVYVGLDCQSMRSHEYRAHLDFGEEATVLEQEHLNRLYDQARRAEFPRQSVLAITDPLYYIDGKRELNPKGVRCRSVEADYQIITIREDIHRNIFEVFEVKLDLLVEDILVAPLAEASVTLTKEEIILGCAYINIGGGTTSISVYKGRRLVAMCVLPLGGQNVTKDLTALKLLEQDAEQVKLLYGSMNTEVDKSEMITATSINGTGDKMLSRYEVNTYIQARMNELTENIKALILDIAPQLSIGYIVFSGGGARLRGYMESLKLEQMGRYATVRPELLAEGTDPSLLSDYQTALGLVAMSTNNCVDHEVVPLEDLFTQDIERDDLDQNKHESVPPEEQGGYVFDIEEASQGEEEEEYSEVVEKGRGFIAKVSDWMTRKFGDNDK